MTNTALIIIDVQKGLDDPSLGKRNNPNDEDNIVRLLTHWRQHKQPIIHIQHSSLEPNSPLREDQLGFEYKDQVLPIEGETHFKKHVNSTFVGTNLEAHLKENNISSLVMAGLTTDHCVSTSVRMAENLGFSVTLISDATATHEKTDQDGCHYSAQQIHTTHIASLDQEFCRVKSTQQILMELG